MPTPLAVDWTAISAIATAAASLGALAVIVITLLQRGDVRKSVEAARRAAVAAERSVEVQIAAHDEQSRLAAYPALSCRFVQADPVSLVIENPSDVLAIDVRVMAVMHLWTDDGEPEEFARRWVKPEWHGLLLGLAEAGEGEYGVRDFVDYGSFPPRKAITVPLGFPGRPEYMAALLQFRDVLGRNYMRVVHSDWAPLDGRYRTVVIDDGDLLQEAPRIDRLPSKSETPPVLSSSAADFMDRYPYAIPSRMLEVPDGENEDRGTWSDLR